MCVGAGYSEMLGTTRWRWDLQFNWLPLVRSTHKNDRRTFQNELRYDSHVEPHTKTLARTKLVRKFDAIVKSKSERRHRHPRVARSPGLVSSLDVRNRGRGVTDVCDLNMAIVGEFGRRISNSIDLLGKYFAIRIKNVGPYLEPKRGALPEPRKDVPSQHKRSKYSTPPRSDVGDAQDFVSRVNRLINAISTKPGAKKPKMEKKVGFTSIYRILTTEIGGMDA